jgi:hypothetical protein
MLKNKQLWRTALALLLLTGLSLWTAPVFAADKPASTKSSTTKTTAPVKGATADISAQVASTYNADATVQQGMIVQLKDKAPTDVTALASSSTSKILGVVIPNNNVAIVLTPQTVTKQQVLVATNGKHEVLVSNQDGPIKVGDFLSISAITGVAMKSGVTQEQVIGKAAGNFTGTAAVISSVNVKDQLGKDNKIAIGRITVDISIAHNPLNQKTVDFVPAFLVSLAQSVANKSVSVARIYLSSVVVFATTVISAIMLYSGVRSGMIAVGRNPLSKKSIIKSLIQTVIAGLIVFIVGILAVYLLLKL